MISHADSCPVGRSILRILVLLLVLTLMIQTVFLFMHRKEQQAELKNWAASATLDLAGRLEIALKEAAAHADQLAQSLSGTKCSSLETKKILQSINFTRSGFDAIGAAYTVFGCETGRRLYAPFITNLGDSRKIQYVDHYYDYASAGSKTIQHVGGDEQWFSRALGELNTWMSPHYEEAMSTHIIRYNAGIYDEEGGLIGTAFVDLTLDRIKKYLENYDIGDNNYIAVFNKKKQLVYHSLESYHALIGKLTDGSSREYDSSLFLQDFGKSSQRTTNKLTGRPAWLHTRTVGSTGWVLMSVISKPGSPVLLEKYISPFGGEKVKNWRRKLLEFSNEQNRVAWIFWIVVTLVTAMVCLRVTYGNHVNRTLWIDSCACSLCFFLGAVGIWLQEYNTMRDVDSIIISNKAVLEEFKNQHALTSLKHHQQAPRYVPIGLFVQSIEFISATNVKISGYMWHRYKDAKFSEKVTSGTIFPEATSVKIEKAYEEKVNNEIVKGWYFSATLRQRSDPARFPLDQQMISVRLWHENIGNHVVLVPDFISYDSLNTCSLPGIERKFILPDWTLLRSFFGVRYNTYNSSLGYSKYYSGISVPDLSFNISLRRNFLNPFLSNLFPLLVVQMMLFAIMMTSSIQEKKKDLMGFSVSSIVKSTTGLFFVALVAHIQMRRVLLAESILYLEYFYMITYFMIIFISANALILTESGITISCVQMHDNLIPKLLYWPLLFGGLFLVTVLIFI